MLKIVTEPGMRRLWSPRTVAASVLVHAVLAAGIVMAIRSGGSPVEEDPPLVEIPIGLVQPERREPTPPPPQPTEARPMGGQTVELMAPELVPDTIRQQNPKFRPLLEEHVTGVGRLGAEYGLPDPDSVVPAATENTGPQPGAGPLPVFYAPIPADSADTRPELANRRQAEMILQRSYPQLLREEGAMGRTTVMLIIDREGQVEPGSVQVQETTHDEFKDAAIHAVEQFRFRPATLKGQPVAVLVTLPIQWRLEN